MIHDQSRINKVFSKFILTPPSIPQGPWMHAMVVAVVLKSGPQRACRVLQWWLWTASPRSTRLCLWIALSVCKRLWLASRKKLSSWRITSSNWWRRSAKRPSEWHGSKHREQRKRDGDNIFITTLNFFFSWEPFPIELRVFGFYWCSEWWYIVLKQYWWVDKVLKLTTFPMQMRGNIWYSVSDPTAE